MYIQLPHWWPPITRAYWCLCSLPSRVLTVCQAVAQVMCSDPGSRSESSLLGCGGQRGLGAPVCWGGVSRGAWVHPSAGVGCAGGPGCARLCYQLPLWVPGALLPTRLHD